LQDNHTLRQTILGVDITSTQGDIRIQILAASPISTQKQFELDLLNTSK